MGSGGLDSFPVSGPINWWSWSGVPEPGSIEHSSPNTSLPVPHALSRSSGTPIREAGLLFKDKEICSRYNDS